MTLVRDVVEQGSARLEAAGVVSPRVDAELLAAYVLGVSRGELASQIVLGREMPDDTVANVDQLLARRVAREPLQHITGTAPFAGLDLGVGPGVFVPRPETESLAQDAAAEANALADQWGSGGFVPLVVDLCTGSGAVALAVANMAPAARVVGVEISDDAAVYAAMNVAQYAPDGRVRLVIDDAGSPRILGDLVGVVDIVTSNPPYIPPDAVPREIEVRDYDPRIALFGGGPDGLEIPRRVTANAVRLLRPGGLYLMEHADVQGEAVREMLDATGAFEEIETRQDLTGRDRYVMARRVTTSAGGGRLDPGGVPTNDL